jgi:hypothetical protein
MREARAAAATAVRNRAALSGGAYGALHGAGDADGSIGDRIVGGLTGAAEGAAGAFGLTAAGQAAGRVIPRVTATVKRGYDAVGDYLGQNEPSPTVQGQPNFVQIARDLSIQRTPGTAGGPITRALQAVVGVSPGASLAMNAAKAREVNDVAAAAQRVAGSVGTPTTRESAGEALAQGAADYKATSATEGGGLYDQRDALVGGTGSPVPTPQTKAAIDGMASNFPTSPAIAQLREHPVIRAIERALPGDGEAPLTLGEATEALSHIRGVSRNLAAQGSATAPILARVNQVKNALTNDVIGAARDADIAAGRVPGAEGSAVKAQSDADSYWADRAAALNGSLKKPLASSNSPETVSGEGVYAQVSKNMDKDRGNLAALRDMWFRLPQEARSTFAATKIDDMGRATAVNQDETGKVWDYGKFVDNWQSLSPQARNIVFGANAEKQLNQIAAYAARLRQTGGSARITNRVQQVFNTVFMGGIVGSLGHGDFGHAASTAIGGGASYLGAHLFLATPKMRDWTVQAMKAVTNAAQGQNNETAFKVLTKRLGSIAAADPTIADQALGLQRHIMQAVNDNVSLAAASSGNQQQKGKDAKPQ